MIIISKRKKRRNWNSAHFNPGTLFVLNLILFNRIVSKSPNKSRTRDEVSPIGYEESVNRMRMAH